MLDGLAPAFAFGFIAGVMPGTWLGVALLAVFAVLLLLYDAGVTDRHGL